MEKSFEEFRKKLIKMHEEDNNKHALQWFLNDIFEQAEINMVCKSKIDKGEEIARLEYYNASKEMWKKLDKIKPKINGRYLVCWSEPYSKEMSYSIEYFHNDRFIRQFAGANEVLFWKELPKLPNTSKELRTRRCRR